MIEDSRSICGLCKKPHFAGDFTCVNCLAMDRAIERNSFRKIIQDYLDGNYPRASKNEKCKHDRYGFEGCENCIDNYFTKALEGL